MVSDMMRMTVSLLQYNAHRGLLPPNASIEIVDDRDRPIIELHGDKAIEDYVLDIDAFEAGLL